MKSNQKNKQFSTRNQLFSIWNHLNAGRKLQLMLALFLMLGSGLCEFITLTAVLPFLSILSDPLVFQKNYYFRGLIAFTGLSNDSHVLTFVTLLFCLIVLFSAAIRLINLRYGFRLSAAIGSDLSVETFSIVLNTSYQEFILSNSSSLITNIITHISRTVIALTSFLQLTSASLVCTGLLLGLFFINPSLTFAALVIFGSIYLFLAITTRRELAVNSRSISNLSKLQIKSIQEGLGGFRDLYLSGYQSVYIEKYKAFDVPQRLLQAKNQFLSSYPRFSIEALGIILIAILGNFLINNAESHELVIPILGTFALGAQRLLPSIQQIYSSWSRLIAFSADLQEVVAVLNAKKKNVSAQLISYSLKDSIVLNNVYFSYDAVKGMVIRDFNLHIQKGQRIGFVGETGCGKSTVLDIIMGLLTPSNGKLLVDGIDLHAPQNQEILQAWRQSISHVPQDIYLSDATIAENIAFGLPKHEINFNLLKLAAAKAQISSFVDSCPDGYDTIVGERGINLSGGQKQRIGIARAMYKNVDVLVLDEATSALDNITEQRIINEIEKSDPGLTILMIAHRLSTLNNCDRIITLDKGKIISTT